MVQDIFTKTGRLVDSLTTSIVANPDDPIFTEIEDPKTLVGKLLNLKHPHFKRMGDELISSGLQSFSSQFFLNNTDTDVDAENRATEMAWKIYEILEKEYGQVKFHTAAYADADIETLGEGLAAYHTFNYLLSSMGFSSLQTTRREDRGKLFDFFTGPITDATSAFVAGEGGNDKLTNPMSVAFQRPIPPGDNIFYIAGNIDLTPEIRVKLKEELVELKNFSKNFLIPLADKKSAGFSNSLSSNNDITYLFADILDAVGGENIRGAYTIASVQPGLKTLGLSARGISEIS